MISVFLKIDSIVSSIFLLSSYNINSNSYVLFLINHDWVTLGTLGVFSLSSCVGDWYNVFNALTQMPKGAKTYLCGFNSYWYMPNGNRKEEKIENIEKIEE